jgi:hypothetical protein
MHNPGNNPWVTPGNPMRRRPELNPLDLPPRLDPDDEDEEQGAGGEQKSRPSGLRRFIPRGLGRLFKKDAGTQE